MQNPAVFVRVSTPEGHFTMPAAVAARSGSDTTILKQDALSKTGRPLEPKLRVDMADTPPAAKKKAAKRAAANKLRDDKVAATPTKPEAPAAGDNSEE